MKQKSISLLAVLITVAAVTAVFLTEPGPRLIERETLPLAVTVSELQVRDVQPWRMLTGRFVPLKTSDLKFEVAGRIEARYVATGKPVVAGEVLLKLDDRDYRDAVTKMQAEFDLVAAEVGRDKRLLVLAKNSSELQEREVARLADLVTKNLTTKSSLDASRRELISLQSGEAEIAHSVSVAKARLDLIRAERDRAERDLERTELVAPFTGVVNRIATEVGSYVGAGQVAATVVDVSKLDLLLHLGGETASALAIGEIVEIELSEAGATASNIQGRLTSLQVDPDPETFTYAAHVRVANDGLRAGMTARARLPQPRRNGVITVPIAAVQYLDGHTYVFAEYDGTLKRIRVSLGARIADNVIVESGLEPGLRVVLHDVDKLADGQKVAVRRGTEPLH